MSAKNNINMVELCEKCGENPVMYGKICGRCYFQDSIQPQMERLNQIQVYAERQTDIIGEILEEIVKIIVEKDKEEKIDRRKQGVETILQKHGKTYGISFMVKKLNEAEKQEWERNIEEHPQ